MTGAKGHNVSGRDGSRSPESKMPFSKFKHRIIDENMMKKVARRKRHTQRRNGEILKLTLTAITGEQEQQETQKTLNVSCCGKRKLQPLLKRRMYSYAWQLL